MILDNKKNYGSNENIKTVWDCIYDYSNPEKGREGKMDIVTGFFSVAALHILYTDLSKDNKYRIVLGDIHDMARDEDFLKKAVNLLQGDGNFESGFQLSTYAKNAVEFLKRKTVEVRTINNAFCHAKSYIFEDNNDAAHDYGIVGSSNLTEAGLGIKESANVELNLVETGRENAAVKDLKKWFENQWDNVASAKINIPIEEGKTIEKDAKTYLIEQIEQIFKAYTPEEIYQKILFEFFRADIEMNDSIEYRREMEFLQKSKIWNTLFKFQQSGVVSLVKLLTRYGGAIMADAVGLGKTFSALGVIKYFQNNGYHTLILCPKKLRNNWTRYQVNANSLFEDDRFSYVVRCHTDLQDNRINKYDDNVTEEAILSHEKLLVVIDESHNLRNHKSSRYQKLLDEIIRKSAQKEHTVKVLLLSATPINTGLIDIRNQFKLIGYKENKHFYNEFGLSVPNDDEGDLYRIFKNANTKYTEWSVEPNHTVNTLRTKLSSVPNFFKLTDELIIARNRAFVTSYESSLTFPTQLRPQNEHVSVRNIGSYANMDAIYDDMKILRLTAYQPTQYEYELYPDIIDRATAILNNVRNSRPNNAINDDERRLYDSLMNVRNETRSEILQEMIAQNWIVKQSIRRFYQGSINWQNNALRELSLAGMMISLFVKRLESSYDSCLNTLIKVRDLHTKWLDYAEQRSNVDLDDEDDTTSQEEDMETIGKRTVDFSHMLRIDDYISDLRRDIEILNRLISNLQQYKDDISDGKRSDEKLDTLISILRQKQNESNKKVVIFTSYTDTALYIYSHIADILPNVDYVTGDIGLKELESKLQRFAPYSKLFKEKRWDNLYANAGINPKDFEDIALYQQWRSLIDSTNNDAKQCLNNPINILVATDCISEGQNLQDADMVINYDIHWNPVRLIQRFGRIDRIGSPNDKIKCVNFWPSEDIEAYLGLSDRVTNRMVAMNVAGSETLQANEEIAQMEKNNQFRQSQDAKSLKSIHDDQVGEIEDIGNPTFDVLSLSEFKADAEEYAQKHLKELECMPNGAFSGFRWRLQPYADYPECLVALLRHREDAKSFHLLCIPIDKTVQATFRKIDKAEVLNLLSSHKKEQTYLPQEILCANPTVLKKLSLVINNWFEPRTKEVVLDTIHNMLDDNDEVVQGNNDEDIDQTIDISKYDLIAWDYVSSKNNE